MQQVDDGLGLVDRFSCGGRPGDRVEAVGETDLERQRAGPHLRLAQPGRDSIRQPHEVGPHLRCEVRVPSERLLVPDRLGVPVRLDLAVIGSDGKGGEVVRLIRAERRREYCQVDESQVADREDPEPDELLQCGRSYTPQSLHRKRIEERLLGPRIHDGHALPRIDSVWVCMGLRFNGREFGQKLVRGHADAAPEIQFGRNFVANSACDRRAVAEEAPGTGDIEKRLVERKRFDEWRIPIEDQPDLSKIMKKLDTVTTGVENLTKSFSGDEIGNLIGPITDFIKQNTEPLSLTIANMSEISGQISSGEGSVGKIIFDDALYVSVTTTLSDLQTAVSDIQVSIEDARGLMTNVDEGEGTVGLLLRDDTLYNETTASMSNLREILEKVNQGKGTAGLFVNEQDFYNNAKLMLQKVEKSVESLEDTGPLSVLGIAVGSLF